MTLDELAALIDHSLLRPNATRDDIGRLCAEARAHGFGAVCVAPRWVETAARTLADTATRVVSVVGFPHGDTLTETKAHEAKLALEHGARELDMVMAIGALKSGDSDAVLRDIAAVVAVGHAQRATVKVILETALLTEAEKVLGCRLAEEAGADFVKTSTGFGPGGATVADVALLRRTVGNRLGVKASGGIRTLKDGLAMLRAGASRLGTSASVGILRELEAELRRPPR
jgi:deoxyribose-phosphate aldolase